MVKFLMGVQGGFTKVGNGHSGLRSRWGRNVKWEPLIHIQNRKVLSPPLHLKLGLMKQFVTALDKESAAFKYLRDFFPKLSAAKVKAGVFVESQIKKIMACKKFPKKLTRTEEAAWNNFVAVVRGFLENHNADNYV